MGRIVVDNLDQYGVSRDSSKYTLPNNAWSHSVNARFQDGKVVQGGGDLQVFGTPNHSSYWVLPVNTPGAYYWLYAGATSVGVTDMASHYDITQPGGYNATLAQGWNGSVFNGIPVINNSVEVPQQWAPVGTGTNLADLTNWPASWRCKVIRAYGNHLIAMDMSEGGTDYPMSVRWSSPAIPGSVPASWDGTNISTGAGSAPLAHTAGDIVDGVGFRKSFVIYKNDSVYVMQRTRNRDIMQVDQVFNSFGLISRECVAPLDNGHLAVTQNDVVFHNLSTYQSVINKKFRTHLFKSLNRDALNSMFIVVNKRRKEVWICYPPAPSGTSSTDALIWNYESNTWAVEQLSNMVAGSYGVIDEAASAETWTNTSGTWETDNKNWNETSFDETQQRMLMVSDTGNMFLVDTEQNLAAGSIRREGRFYSDGIKTLTRLIPSVKSNLPIVVRIGSEMREEEGVKWQERITFDPSTDYAIDTFVPFRSLAVEYIYPKDASFELSREIYEVSDMEAYQ